MRNVGIIYYASFWNESNGLHCPYFVNNSLKSASIHKTVQIFYNNLSVVLGSEKGGTLKLLTTKHKDWVSMQLLPLSVFTFLFTLPRCQVILSWKQTNKKRLGNTLSAWRSFRVDLTWRMGKQQAENEKQTFFEILYWEVFQFFIQKCRTWQNNNCWCDIISTKKHDVGGLPWTKY